MEEEIKTTGAAGNFIGKIRLPFPDVKPILEKVRPCISQKERIGVNEP